MKNYIFNLETTKIELHFERTEYDTLSETLKADLKSAFMWKRSGGCWVSRAKEPNLWRAKQVAKKLGFTEEQREGERLTFAEQVERQAERAENRADRYEEYAGNAERRGAALQKPLDSMRGDTAFFTQPIIAGHSGSQAFARRRERMYQQYSSGFEEYRKSEYFRGRAETARETADGAKYKDVAYLENCIDDCGGIRFSKDNIEVGYIVIVQRWGEVEVISVGPKNIVFKILKGGASGGTLQAAYAEITEVVKSVVKKQETHPFKVGERFTAERLSYEGNSFKSTRSQVIYEIIKASDTTIQLKAVDTDEKPITRKPKKSFNSGWCFSIDDMYNNTFYKV